MKNNRFQKLVAPGMRLYLIIIMVIFAVVTFFLNEKVAMVEGAIILILIIYSLVDARRRRKRLVDYIEDVTYNAESAKNNTLMNFPLPIVVFKMDDYQIIWGNQIFFNLFGQQKPSFDASLSEMIPGFTGKWLLEGKNQYPGLVQVDGRKYQLHGNIIRGRDDEKNSGSAFMGISYWVDVTEFDDIKLEYEASRPATMIFVVDNYDELTKGITDRKRMELRGLIDEEISKFCEGKGGLLRRFDTDRYMFIFESRYLKEFTSAKFGILEDIHSVINSGGIHATLSVGVGCDGADYDENFAFANLAIEMALSRGGDQAVIKNRYNFEFFGGKGMEIETRTKVKSRVTANALAELMRSSGQIYAMGHKLADLDSVGGAVGIVCIARKLGKTAKIVVDPEKNFSHDLIESLKRSPEYRDVFITPEEAMLAADSRTLLVVVDTNRPEQVESLNLLESCTRVAVIDHHRRAASYIQNAALSFHEPYASSVCELITELMQELLTQEDITRLEAEAVLSGIVLDTKHFTIRTGERTFDAAAFLRRVGADTSEVKKLLRTGMENTVARYKILQSAKVYRGDIAIAVQETEIDRIVAAQAADELLNISGIEASIVAYATNDGGVVVSARSIGDVNVQLILEKLGGGGNKGAAGAQVSNMSLREAVNMICASIDEYSN